MLVDMKCLRCQTPMKFIGTRNYLEGSWLTQWTQMTPRNTKANKEYLHFYACPQCGKVEFFLPEPYYKDLDAADSFREFDISVAKDGDSPQMADLFKIKPGLTSLEKVNELLGYPFCYHVFGETAVLCYRSEDPSHPHVILLDRQNQMARMVAIYNHNTYTSASLHQSFGTPQTIGAINDYEHFFFVEKGVAYITSGKDAQKIVYAQFFEPKMTLNEYIKADGFTAEVFFCADC